MSPPLVVSTPAGRRLWLARCNTPAVRVGHAREVAPYSPGAGTEAYTLICLVPRPALLLALRLNNSRLPAQSVSTVTRSPITIGLAIDCFHRPPAVAGSSPASILNGFVDAPFAPGACALREYSFSAPDLPAWMAIDRRDFATARAGCVPRMSDGWTSYLVSIWRLRISLVCGPGRGRQIARRGSRW
jgi:hypothetical protein